MAHAPIPMTTTPDSSWPLAAAYRAAEVAYDAADEAIQQAMCCPGRCATCEPLWQAAEAADEAVIAARGAWMASDEPRDWRVGEDRLPDVSPSVIEEELEGWARRATAGSPSMTTQWRSLLASPIDPTTDESIPAEEVSIRVTIDPTEPGCVEAHRHAWLAPLSLVGGAPEEPGVRHHGAGSLATEVCARCGWYRDTDTWATDPGTGEQGLTSTAYRAPDDASRAWADRIAGYLAAVES